MTNLKNIRLFWAIVIAGVFFISKEFYVVNEETLVAITFITFVYLTYDVLSNLLAEMLDERSELIAKEFDVFAEAKEKSLELMIGYYKQQTTVFEKIQNFINFLNDKLIVSLQNKNKLVEQTLIQQQQQKLNVLLQKETALLQEVQEEVSYYFSRSVTDQFKENNNRSRLFKEIALEEAIQIIGTLSNSDVSDSDILRTLNTVHYFADVPWDVLVTAHILSNQ